MGGNSGGGTNDWPHYMQSVHMTWLNRGGMDGLKYSVTYLMSQAQGNSPYANFKSPSPSAVFGTFDLRLFDMVEDFAKLNLSSLWASTLNDSVVGSVVTSAIKTTAQLIEDELEQNVLPEFRAGMRNINAVQSTAFVVGEAVLRSAGVKAIAKAATDIQLKMIDVANTVFQLKLQWYKDVVSVGTEVSRIYLAASMDAMKMDVELAAKHKLWDLRTFEMGASVMASISGGGLPSSAQESSQVATAIGGAMSGAAMGATVGGPYGAAVGGVVGLAASFMR